MQQADQENQTRENLRMAFAGSAMARTRYEILAGQARRKGEVSLAGLLRELADENGRQAEEWYRLLAGEEGELQENLQDLIETERVQAAEILPEFAEAAKTEGDEETKERMMREAEAAKKREDLLATCRETA